MVLPTATYVSRRVVQALWLLLGVMIYPVQRMKGCQAHTHIQKQEAPKVLTTAGCMQELSSSPKVGVSLQQQHPIQQLLHTVLPAAAAVAVAARQATGPARASLTTAEG